MIPVAVKVTKYQADGADGRIFDTAEEAIHYEKLKNGERKICTECKGTGKVDLYGDDRFHAICDKCQGKGWLEKKEVWM